MPLELYYFPIRGRGEVARLMCVANGAEYTETAPEYSAMKADKDNYPFGQLPRLVDGDISLAQSNAIIRYLARKFNMYGQSQAEMAKVDILLDCVEDWRMCYIKFIYGNKASDEAKPEFMQQFNTHAENINRYIAKGANPFVLGAEPSAADLALYDICWLVLRQDSNFLESHAALKALFEAVEAIPGIKKYIEEGKGHERVNGNGLG